jgi:hypothetical protein
MKMPLIAAFGVLAFACAPAPAQVFIKPSGARAIPLRVQSLRAEVDIVGALATTNWTMTAHLENAGFSDNYAGTVCDFICARPVDAKVTAFSVNSLNGRVVDRAVAAPIVAFRAAKNDPLLKSGLNASNSFRATIYPLNSWGEVTIRGTWVQPLGSSRGKATYRLPLLSLKGATMRLPELGAKISIYGSAWASVSNSYELPAQTQPHTPTQYSARVFSLGQKNYRVLRDLVVTLAPQKPPARAPMMISEDGHFAFAFVAPKTLRGARVTGQGIDSSSVAPLVRAGEVVTLTGLHHTNGRSFSPVLSAEGLNGHLRLEPFVNEGARGLWATQQINVLSKNVKANRGQIVALSKKFSVVSRFTSWLSVGDEDLKIYRRALVSSQLDPLVREYWMRVGDGQTKSARVVRLRQAIAQISRGNGLKVEDELYARLGSAVKYAASAGYFYNEKPRTREQKRFARLQATSDKRLKTLGVSDNKVVLPIRDDLGSLRDKINNEYHKPHPDYAQLNKWERHFAQLYGATELDPRLEMWRTRINSQNLESQTASAEKAGDQTRLAKLQDERKQVSNNIYFTNNIGDPPIYVQAPADARGVVAVMPDGKVKTLDYNRWQKRWEGNYDVPVGTKDGDYTIQIIVALADGSRKRSEMPFRVDTKAPSGKGGVLLAPDGRSLRLQVEGGGDVAFVSALLPWGEKVLLLPSTQSGNAFFALARVPQNFAGQPLKVTFILIDRAHNIASVEATSLSPAPLPLR